ncbi:MAG: phosphopyruvate hydratase [Planctomycetia bacterium]|nr:phosphopyruvate hydratase [Planctomycetia bacterium]
MAAIAKVRAREVLDSRGRPTVEVEIAASDGSVASALVPSGASTGTAEACELRDGDAARYDGLGVLRAVENVERVLGPAATGLDPADQETIDRRLLELDGTANKSRLGANAVLGVSLAAAHLAAASSRVPLYRHFCELWQRAAGRFGTGGKKAPRMPVPMTNMISGGLHAGGNLDFQDFLVVPHGAADFPTGLEWIVRIYRRLGRLLSEAGYEGRLVGDEGGYGPRLEDHRQAAQFVVRAIEAAKLRPGQDASLAIDVASTHFFDGRHYRLSLPGAVPLSSAEMIELLVELATHFPVVSIEDGLAEEDWFGWQELCQRLGDRVRLVGDDLFATNAERVKHGIELQAANSVLVKMNQVGTVTETLETMVLADAAGWQRVVSARSGETEDASIADLAVGTAAQHIKIGSVARSERLAKYNRLLRIAEEVGG